MVLRWGYGVVLLSVFCPSALAIDSDKVLSLQLYDEKTQNIPQISGMTRFKEWLLFVSQEQHKVYYASVADINEALEHHEVSITLKHIALTGELPLKPSWEALEVVGGDQIQTLVLSHEHNGKNGDAPFHQLFSAAVFSASDPKVFSLGHTTPLGENLPFFRDKQGFTQPYTNFGYEAIFWLPYSERIILMPELSRREAYSIDKINQITHLEVAPHGYRISDAAPLGQHCVAITSFCYKDDPICEKSDGKSSLKLAVFKLEEKRLKLLDERVLPNHMLKYQLSWLYNAEAIAIHGTYLYLVNDNRPGKNAKSVLRRLPNPFTEQPQCR